MKLLLYTLAILNALDAVMTWVCLYSGLFEEANPLLQPYMTDPVSVRMAAVMMFKLLLSCFIVVLAYYWYQFPEWHRLIWCPIVFLAIVVYLVTTINNIIGVVQCL